jgi:hypothetical protein
MGEDSIEQTLDVVLAPHPLMAALHVAKRHDGRMRVAVVVAVASVRAAKLELTFQEVNARFARSLLTISEHGLTSGPYHWAKVHL